MMQIRFRSSDYFAAEHKRSQSVSAMLPTDLAHPIGVVSGTKVGGTRKPRTTTVALTDCLVTRADGSQYIIPRGSRNASKSRKVSARKQFVPEPHRKLTAADLAPIFAD